MKTLFDYCTDRKNLRKKVRDLVKNGEKKKDVARKFNLRYDKVVYWTKDIGKRRYYPPEFKEEVRRRVKNGEMKSKIARNMGLSTSTVTYWS